MLDLDHVKGLLKVCHSTLLSVHCGINNSVSKEQFEDVNSQYRDVCFSFSPKVKFVKLELDLVPYIISKFQSNGWSKYK
jgi:hypothetical protein